MTPERTGMKDVFLAGPGGAGAAGAADALPPSSQGQVSDALARMNNSQREHRIKELVHTHYDFIYRTLRRFGLVAPDAEDAAQEVFLIACRRLESISSESERSFLIGTAVRVAARQRRGIARRRELLDLRPLDRRADDHLDPEQSADRHRARATVDEVLRSMSQQLRTVFVLFEIEEVCMSEIAQALNLPAGTVASRLRRARQAFRSAAKLRHARDTFRLGAVR